jgi:integrase
LSACRPRPEAYTIHWDGELKGFGVRITAHGVKTFILQRRVNGKERRITIGRLGPLTAVEARREATKLLGAIATGRDPMAERQQARVEAVSLDEVFTSYLSARGDLRPGSVETYQRIMAASFADWGKRPLPEITGDMVGARHALLAKAHGKAWANLSMRLLRAIFNFAAGSYEEGGKLLDNPVRRLTRTRAWFRVDRRETLIRPHQLRPWMDAVLALDSEHARTYLQLVLLTGLRRSEALGLKWRDVDLVGRTLTVRATKNHRDHTLPLPGYLTALLGRLPRHGVHVFEEWRGLRFALEEVARRSGVLFCVHDLRRGFATAADGIDLPGYAVRALLNHQGGDVTSGYVLVTVERLREPMQRICDYTTCSGARVWRSRRRCCRSSAPIGPAGRKDRSHDHDDPGSVRGPPRGRRHRREGGGCGRGLGERQGTRAVGDEGGSR